MRDQDSPARAFPRKARKFDVKRCIDEFSAPGPHAELVGGGIRTIPEILASHTRRDAALVAHRERIPAFQPFFHWDAIVVKRWLESRRFSGFTKPLFCLYNFSILLLIITANRGNVFW